VLAKRVEAGLRQNESLNRLSAYDVRLDNLIHIAGCDPAVPNSIRIDDEIRAMLALIKTTRLIRPYFSLKPTFRQLLFEEFLQFRPTLWIAASARCSGRALVAANEDMLLKLWHKGNL
jgi:hypothetical protein